MSSAPTPPSSFREWRDMAEERKEFPVLEPVKVGGKRYEPGDTVALTAAEAGELKKLGIVADPLTPEQIAEARAAKISAFVMGLTIADFGKKQALTDSGRAKAEAALGFVPEPDEVRQGMEAWAKAAADKDGDAKE